MKKIKKAIIEIDDYYEYNFKRRYGYGGLLPSHEIIENTLSKGIDSYRRLLNKFLPYTDQLMTIRRLPDKNHPSEAAWLNNFLPAFDAVTLYGMISINKPKLFLEIGSGNSSRFAAKARENNSPSTKIVSIDPNPRGEIDDLCDVVLRKPLEECDLAIFHELGEKDILFFDGSHRTLQNSDCSVFFLEILPHLRSDVYVHVHDIFWPFDYPDEWAQRMYSEQYILGTMILFAHEKFDFILPNCFISWQTDLIHLFDRLWTSPNLEGASIHGASFWFTKRNNS
jgi:Methyltransferase domain